MIKSLFKPKKKPSAQAMVEFALALPILLALLYGTIEVSRLIFIFSSVAIASRQAARYGSASGAIDGVPFYQNCDGIREVANQSAFITTFDKINITYDRGVNSKGAQIPITDINPSPEVNTCPIERNAVRNGDRIIVQVSSTYKPIFPILSFKPLEIVSASARTILVSIPIFGSALPTGFAAESSTPSITPLATSTGALPTITTAATFSATKTPPSRYTPSYATPTYATPTNAGLPNPLTPVVIFTPSQTPLPSDTPTAGPTQIRCTGQTGVTHGPLTISNNVLQMKINNATGVTLTTSQIYVEWNNDMGHRNGGDPTLRLRQATLAGQTWNGDLLAPSIFIPGYTPNIPPGESIIQFTLHQTYDVTDGTERIIIYISTPGCTNYLVDSMN
ncbi:MAG: pilus assembly protein [Chloroflexi bacterium]|nr:pilus assembly protein [Chloroflexota bacterium]